MTNAELITTIRNEIERRMRAYDESIEKYADKKKSMKAERDAWRWAECKSLLSFLSTLEKSEKPINHEEELEAEIQSFWNRASGFQPKFATLEVKENGFATIARHFAKWGAENLKK